MLNHLFISWKTLLRIFSNIIKLGLLTIILVSSAKKATSALSFIDFGRSLICNKKTMVQVLILVGHHALSIPNLRSHEDCCPESLSDICPLIMI
jgi:hypothetical protein